MYELFIRRSSFEIITYIFIIFFCIGNVRRDVVMLSICLLWVSTNVQTCFDMKAAGKDARDDEYNY